MPALKLIQSQKNDCTPKLRRARFHNYLKKSGCYMSQRCHIIVYKIPVINWLTGMDFFQPLQCETLAQGRKKSCEHVIWFHVKHGGSLKMNKTIYTAIVLVAAFAAPSAWAGAGTHQSGTIHLDCVQSDSSQAKHKDGKVHFECVQNSKLSKKPADHKYHEKTDNAFD